MFLRGSADGQRCGSRSQSPRVVAEALGAGAKTSGKQFRQHRPEYGEVAVREIADERADDQERERRPCTERKQRNDDRRADHEASERESPAKAIGKPSEADVTD